jgi:DNA-binding NtrC family response regulator
MKNQFTAKTFIVDDDPYWTAMLNQILSDLGFSNISHFSNGKDCINNLDKNPRLIFLDYQMADMDGLEVLQKVKQYNSETVVVFCTSQNELSVAINAMKSGSFDYLAKSVSPVKELGVIIKQMQEKRVFAEKVF